MTSLPGCMRKTWPRHLYSMYLYGYNLNVVTAFDYQWPRYLAGKTWWSSKMDVSPVNNPETYRHWFPQSLGHKLWEFLQKVCSKILRFKIGFDRTDRHDDASSEAGLWSLTDKIGYSLYWGWTLSMSRAKVSQSDLAYTWGDITGVCVQLPSMPVLRPYLFGSWFSVGLPAGVTSNMYPPYKTYPQVTII